MTAAPAHVRIVFDPYTHPDGQVQHFDDEILTDSEKAEFEPGWLHVVTFDDFGNREWLRSYPTHNILSVRRG